MEYRLRPWVSWSFLQNNNHQAVKKMEWIENRKIWKNSCNTCVIETITHTRIHTHTLTHLQPHINEIPTVFVWIFSVFSIFNSFHLVNCLMIVVLQKTPWNPGLQSIFHELKIYIYLIYIYLSLIILLL